VTSEEGELWKELALATEEGCRCGNLNCAAYKRLAMAREALGLKPIRSSLHNDAIVRSGVQR